jgi:hypothetical protein
MEGVAVPFMRFLVALVGYVVLRNRITWTREGNQRRLRLSTGAAATVIMGVVRPFCIASPEAA